MLVKLAREQHTLRVQEMHFTCDHVSHVSLISRIVAMSRRTVEDYIFIIMTVFSHSFVVGIFVLMLYLFGEAYERGFFCNDESLMHPYNSDTVTMTMLVTTGILVPIAIVSEFLLPAYKVESHD